MWQTRFSGGTHMDRAIYGQAARSLAPKKINAKFNGAWLLLIAAIFGCGEKDNGGDSISTKAIAILSGRSSTAVDERLVLLRVRNIGGDFRKEVAQVSVRAYCNGDFYREYQRTNDIILPKSKACSLEVTALHRPWNDSVVTYVQDVSRRAVDHAALQLATLVVDGEASAALAGGSEINVVILRQPDASGTADMEYVDIRFADRVPGRPFRNTLAIDFSQGARAIGREPLPEFTFSRADLVEVETGSVGVEYLMHCVAPVAGNSIDRAICSGSEVRNLLAQWQTFGENGSLKADFSEKAGQLAVRGLTSILESPWKARLIAAGSDGLVHGGVGLAMPRSNAMKLGILLDIGQGQDLLVLRLRESTSLRYVAMAPSLESDAVRSYLVTTTQPIPAAASITTLQKLNRRTIEAGVPYGLGLAMVSPVRYSECSIRVQWDGPGTIFPDFKAYPQLVGEYVSLGEGVALSALTQPNADTVIAELNLKALEAGVTAQTIVRLLGLRQSSNNQVSQVRAQWTLQCDGVNYYNSRLQSYLKLTDDEGAQFGESTTEVGCSNAAICFNGVPEAVTNQQSLILTPANPGDFVSYSLKIVDGDGVGCSDLTGYSDWRESSRPAFASFAESQDGMKTICFRGKRADGTVQTEPTIRSYTLTRPTEHDRVDLLLTAVSENRLQRGIAYDVQSDLPASDIDQMSQTDRVYVEIWGKASTAAAGARFYGGALNLAYDMRRVRPAVDTVANSTVIVSELYRSFCLYSFFCSYADSSGATNQGIIQNIGTDTFYFVARAGTPVDAYFRVGYVSFDIVDRQGDAYFSLLPMSENNGAGKLRETDAANKPPELVPWQSARMPFVRLLGGVGPEPTLVVDAGQNMSGEEREWLLNGAVVEGQPTSVTWSLVSAPSGVSASQVAFGSANTLTTSVTVPLEKGGDYVFELTARNDDNIPQALVAKDQVTFTYVPPPPSIALTMGSDIAQQNPSFSKTDIRVTGGSGDFQFVWGMVSGPVDGGDVSISSSFQNGVVTASSSVPRLGSYVFELFVQDRRYSNYTARGRFTFTVTSTSLNIDAGDDRYFRESVTHAGAIDAASGYGPFAVQWDLVSGVGVAFSNSETLSTTITGVTEGATIVRLTVVDRLGNRATDEVRMIRDTTPPTISMPSLLCTRSASVIRSAVVEDSGSGVDVASYSWSINSAGVSLTGVNSLSTTLQFTDDGIYDLQFRAADRAGNVAVGEAKVAHSTQPPTVNAGGDLTAYSAVTLQGQAIPQFSECGVTVSWRQVDGIAAEAVQIVPMDSLTPLVQVVDTSGAADGMYTIELSAADSAGNVASDSMILTWWQERGGGDNPGDDGGGDDSASVGGGFFFVRGSDGSLPAQGGSDSAASLDAVHYMRPGQVDIFLDDNTFSSENIVGAPHQIQVAEVSGACSLAADFSAVQRTGSGILQPFRVSLSGALGVRTLCVKFGNAVYGERIYVVSP